MNVCLVGFPLFLACLQLLHFFLHLVLQQSVLATRQLSRDVAEQVLFLLQHTVLHRVAHHLLTLHDAVGYRSFGLQTLISGNVEAVFYAETEYPDRYSPFVMQVALAQNTSIALSVVHWTVRCVNMDEGVQTLLDVHTSTECGGAAHDNTDFTTVHLVEDFKFLLDTPSRIYNHDLGFGYTSRNEFLANVLIQIEASRFILKPVSKDGNSTVVVLGVFKTAKCLTHGFIGLAVRLVCSIFKYKTWVNGSGLRNTVHRKRNVTVLFLLLATHLLVIVELVFHELHHTTQGFCLWKIDVLCLSTFHLWYLVAHASCLTGQHRVGDTSPYTHKFGEVHITCKSVILLVLAVGAKLQHLLDIAEVAHKVVEIIDAVLAHGVGWHEIAQERPYLGCGVADRRTSGKHHILAVLVLQHGLRLQIYTLRLLAI